MVLEHSAMVPELSAIDSEHNVMVFERNSMDLERIGRIRNGHYGFGP
jgi:hypothetical protein